MVSSSTVSLTSTFLLLLLVLSSAALVASLAIVAAQSQSYSDLPSRQFPQWNFIMYGLISLSLLLSSIGALFSISNNSSNKWPLFLHFCLVTLVTVLFGHALFLLLINPDFSDFNWFIGIGAFVPIILFLLIVLLFEFRTLRSSNN